MKRRIAIIGTGISGLTCGYLLNKDHDITVFEANDYIGGHTATKTVTSQGEQFAIDTGFIVFNDWTYPNFMQLLSHLGVAMQATEMSFSVTSNQNDIEYNGNNLNSLFAQRRNLFRPRFWRIVKDILTFNKACKAAIKQPAKAKGKTLQSFIDELTLSEDFQNWYILPMCAAIWSGSLEQSRHFPLSFFLKFFNNHGLLNITHRPQWFTVKGGSASYIQPLTRQFASAIKLSCPVTRVAKTAGGYEVSADGAEPAIFDDVVFACHSDQALKMLASPTPAQQEILSAIPYANNDVVLHTDTRVLPKRKLAWASWNYRLDDGASRFTKPATVTYNMNILQHLRSAQTFCVTLNSTALIASDKVLGRYTYAHPQFSESMVAAQQRRNEICGIDGLHFCGAYWYNGFHEDGVRSALDVCKRFGIAL